MVQRFARLLFDFACKLAQSLPVCQHTFLFANRWGDSWSSKCWGDCNTWGIFGGNGEGFKKSRTPCDVKQKEMGELVLPVYPVGNFL